MMRQAVAPSIAIIAMLAAAAAACRSASTALPHQESSRESRPWVRAVVELREQLDVTRVAARQRRARLARSERRDRTLALLTELSDRGAREMKPLLERLASRGLVSSWTALRIRNGFVITARPEALDLLRDDPRVGAVAPEYDSVREARRNAGSLVHDEPSLPLPPGDSWAVENLDLGKLWDEGIDGRGVVVGILDSGVDASHASLAAGSAPRAFWFDPSGSHARPVDSTRHGTEVLAAAVGTPVGGRAVGAAPGARWVAALSNPDNGYNSVLMALAADWMLFEARPDVLLGAWGHGRGSCDDRDLWLIEAFRAAGTTPVFAAGNDGPAPSSGQAPATLAGLFPDGRGPLSVGAVDRNDRVIPESARGPRPCGGPPIFPELVAPGWLLPVPAPGHREDLSLGSGTSLAVGWAGGVIALILQVAPDMPVEVVERVVRTSARDLPPRGPDDASGYGMIDPRAAVEAAREWSARERARRR